MNKRYLQQVERMLQILPHVMAEKVFALKGGTAINFFVRDIRKMDKKKHCRQVEKLREVLHL